MLLSANSSHPEVINAVSSRADVHSVGPGVAAAVTCHPTLKAAIDAACQDADLVLAWGGGDYWKLLPAIPKVMVAHGTCYYTHLVVEQAIAGGCTHLCAVSQLSADTLLDLSLPCKVLWNGADESRLQVTLPRDHVQHHVWKCQAEWWFKDIIIVGYLGRLAIEKNVLAAAQAVHSLPWQYKCVLIGTGMAAKEITEQARSMLGKRLTVVPPVDDVGNHYAAFDMVVQASHREGNSLSLIEAMLCGVPIVTTRVGAVAEFEEAAGRELFWSLPDHPTANELAAVVRTVGLQGRNDPRVKAAKEFALAHLTGRKMADNWTEYLQSLV